MTDRARQELLLISPYFVPDEQEVRYLVGIEMGMIVDNPALAATVKRFFDHATRPANAYRVSWSREAYRTPAGCDGWRATTASSELRPRSRRQHAAKLHRAVRNRFARPATSRICPRRLCVASYIQPAWDVR
ncbi:phospholipase D-like domain-containing protein [Dyella agri]|uniref:Uncharacterized protein n=1 Tax=Dyella agri TaxID=1926869 RepID=A0ABW8KNL9_9GAMM